MELIKLKEVINSWDPIGLFPGAPDDEYDCEINQINTYINNNKPSVSKLNKYIYKVFNTSFGDCANITPDSCKAVATTIYNEIITTNNK